VVQRVPVRIALDPKEVAEHPLRIGLSMDAKVDVRRPRAGCSPTRRGHSPQAKTASFDEGRAAADADVQRIIAANLGRPSRRPHARLAATARRSRSAGGAGARAVLRSDRTDERAAATAPGGRRGSSASARRAAGAARARRRRRSPAAPSSSARSRCRWRPS
jgi:hypothetical protein